MLPSHYGHGECAVCEVPIRRGLLMCPEHWRQTGRAERDKVNAALRAYEGGEVTLGELRAAQCAAVAKVQRLEAQRRED